MVELEMSMECDTGRGGVKTGQSLRVGPTRWFIPYDGSRPVRLTPPPRPRRAKAEAWRLGLAILGVIIMTAWLIFCALLLAAWGTTGPALSGAPAWFSVATHNMATASGIFLGVISAICGVGFISELMTADSDG